VQPPPWTVERLLEARWARWCLLGEGERGGRSRDGDIGGVRAFATPPFKVMLLPLVLAVTAVDVPWALEAVAAEAAAKVVSSDCCCCSAAVPCSSCPAVMFMGCPN